MSAILFYKLLMLKVCFFFIYKYKVIKVLYYFFSSYKPDYIYFLLSKV